MVPVPELEERARACASHLLAADDVVLASHNDADGLTSGAIATTALERAGVGVETAFFKQLDEDAVASLAARDHETVLFTDFGSGQLETILEYADSHQFTPVVADHHQPADATAEYHLNPLLFGIDGASELSGAGTTYALARALAELDPDGPRVADGSGQTTDASHQSIDESGPTTHTSSQVTDDNRDLAALAVVGAVGDMQATSGELVGANANIVAEGVEVGVLAETTDLAFYGRQTRPLPKLLEYQNEVEVPGISNDEAGAVGFLRDLDLDLTAGDDADGDWRRWIDLTDDERQTVASALVQRAIRRGVPADRVGRLVGTTYELVSEATGTELRDASEFSTLLNATARYERADVGLAVCLGNRGPALERARSLLRTHRRNLSQGLEYVQEVGVEHTPSLQYFDAGEEIRDTIVGIVAGMALGVDGVHGGKPIVAFAAENDAETKVSARGTGRLVREGLDLSVVMGQAARAVGGDGGGHDVAAGATIPRGEEAAFVEAAEEIVGEQLE
ncbi:MAG: DHH family phosphoesterase [Haloarculaceae archaeon]